MRGAPPRKPAVPHQFTVDDDLAALVEKLAKPKPFENLTFNAALRRVLTELLQPKANGAAPLDGDTLLAEMMAHLPTPKKAPSPSAAEWAARVKVLRSVGGLTSWKSICDHLEIKTNGDSARRKLQSWVDQRNATGKGAPWPDVPDVPLRLR